MSELKPCPFCGGEAEHKMYLYGNDVNGKAVWRYYVFCTSCDCTSDNMYESEAEAVTAWNARTDTTKLAQIRACIESYRIKKNESDPFEYGRFQEWRAIKTDIDEILEGEK